MTNLLKLESYGHNFQSKVIGALLTDKDFLINIFPILSDEYFENISHQWVVKKIKEYFIKYHTVPSLDVMKVEVQKIDNNTLKVSAKEEITKAYREAEQTDIEYVKSEFLGFCRNQQMKKAILLSAELLNSNDFVSIRNVIAEALRVGETKTAGHEYEKDIETRYREDNRNPIPFPWDIFNDHTQGGMGKGELFLVVGSPGGGKSWAVVSIAMNAAKLGYNVVFYTLELSETYLARRLDANLINIPVQNISYHRGEVEERIQDLEGKIIVKEFAAGRTSLDDIEAHLEQLRNQHDFEPDLVIIDYLDLLKNPSKDRLEGTEDIYTCARGLARTQNLPVVSPAQANREASKNNIIEGNTMAGSYSKLMIGDFVASFARNRKDKLNGTGRFHFIKNRFGPDGMTFSANIDTSTGKIDVYKDLMDIEEQEDLPKTNNQNNYNTWSPEDKQALKRFTYSEDN